ncbi:hypothetical protein GPALN_005563 [Globodera pallida]|nr:hypothetical protein GPALN_005563 [Globodera pallida]
MTSTLPTSSSSSSAPLMGNIAGGIAGGGGNSAGGGTNDAHPPTAPFSLELLATLLARTANSAASAGTACVVPAPIQSNSSAFSANQSNFQSPFATSEVALIQQLLRATNPLLNNAVVGDMAPSALQALLVAGVAQQQHRRATMLVKTESEEDELLTTEVKGSGTPPQTDKMETNDGYFKQAAMFIKTELGSVEQLQPLPHIEEEEEGAEEAKPNLQQHNQPQQQQRRQRVGGSSVKTAEVWRFFTQRPTPEQAATCQICQKTIKATNSSTTGMIRHLRSCHQTEFQQLQQARYLKNLKNDAVERQKVMLQLQLGIDPHSEASIEAIQAALESSLTALQSPPPAMNGGVAPKHSVEALINGDLRSASPNSTAQQRQLLEQIENFKTSRPTSMERLKKEGGTGPDDGRGGQARGGRNAVRRSYKSRNVRFAGDDAAAWHGDKTKKSDVPSPAMTAMTSMVVDGSTTGDFHQQTTPRTVGKKSGASARRTMAMASAMPPPNAGPGEALAGRAKVVEQHQSERISDQIAAMMLVDQTEFLLERVGFRQFVQALVPGYTMPLGGQFRAEIIPRVAKQLQQLALFREELQRNNPFGMPPIGMLLNNSIKTVQYLHQQQHLFTGGSPTALSTSSSSSSDTPSGHVVITNHSSNMTNLISPSSSTEESGFHDEEQHNGSAFGSSNISGGAAAGNANGSGMGMDELVQQAAFHSQNISRSFTFSLDLNSDGSGESAGCDGIAAEKASGKEEDSDTNSSI